MRQWLDKAELGEFFGCQNVSILGAKTAGIKVPANLPRRRHPSAIGHNGMRKKERPGFFALFFFQKSQRCCATLDVMAGKCTFRVVKSSAAV